jgi:hypothetical protein
MRPLALVAIVLFSVTLQARTITEVYKGRVVREEIVRTEPAVDELAAEFQGMVDGKLGFRVSRTRRVVTWFRAYHEQIQVTRNTEDPTDSGIRQLLPGKETPGDMRSETRVEDLGVVRGAEFRLPSGRPLITDKDGFLVDEDEVLLRKFDGIRPQALDVELRAAAAGGTMTLRLKPREPGCRVACRRCGGHHDPSIEAAGTVGCRGIRGRPQGGPGDAASG